MRLKCSILRVHISSECRERLCAAPRIILAGRKAHPSPSLAALGRWPPAAAPQPRGLTDCKERVTRSRIRCQPTTTLKLSGFPRTTQFRLDLVLLPQVICCTIFCVTKLFLQIRQNNFYIWC
jgi:hypothetical protein